MTVVPSTVTSMYDLAVDLLDAVEAAMATTAEGAPVTSYVSLGEPAWGPEACSQAVVQVLALGEGQTSPVSPAEITGIRHPPGHHVNEVSLVAYAVRCLFVSEGNVSPYQPLTVNSLSAAAKQAYEDGWAIWNYINRAIKSQSLFGGQCQIVHFVGGQPINPEAGLGGWRFGLRVELDGYDPTVT